MCPSINHIDHSNLWPALENYRYTVFVCNLKKLTDKVRTYHTRMYCTIFVKTNSYFARARVHPSRSRSDLFFARTRATARKIKISFDSNISILIINMRARALAKYELAFKFFSYLYTWG